MYNGWGPGGEIRVSIQIDAACECAD